LKQVLFYSLTALSILGVSVKPVSAVQPQKQAAPALVNSAAVVGTDDPANHKAKKKERKALFHKKKKVHKWRRVGCPEF
jgi:hypothetical protein